MACDIAFMESTLRKLARHALIKWDLGGIAAKQRLLSSRNLSSPDQSLAMIEARTLTEERLPSASQVIKISTLKWFEAEWPGLSDDTLSTTLHLRLSRQALVSGSGRQRLRRRGIIVPNDGGPQTTQRQILHVQSKAM